MMKTSPYLAARREAQPEPQSSASASPKPLRVLMLQEYPEDAERALHQLRRVGYNPDWRRVETEEDYLTQLMEAPDLILADCVLRQYDVLSALRALREMRLNIPFIVISGVHGEETAVSVMKQGASDYVLKDHIERLGQAVTNALEQKYLLDEKRKTEESLSKSERKLAEAQRLARIGSWEWDIATNSILWSDEMYRLFGLKPRLSDTTYENYLSYLFPEDRIVAEETIEMALQDYQPFSFYHRVVLPDGAIRIMHGRGEVLLDPSGKPTGMRGTCQDVTERKQGELALRAAHEELENRVEERTAALKASEAQLRLVLDTAPASVVYVDKEQRYRFSNQRYTRRFGLLPEDIVGRRVDEVLGEEAYAVIRPYIETALSGTPVTYEMAIPYPEIGERYMHVDYVPDIAADGMVNGFVVMVTDLTERRESENAVKESEERYRFLANAMPQVVWTARPDGYDDYGNERWVEYTGLTLEETKGKGWQAALHPDDVENCNNRWNYALHTGEPYEVEYRFRRASDGAYRWHLGRALPRRGADGEIVQWVGTYTDIEDFKRVQSELERMNDELEARVRERTAELERSNRDLQEFAYVASHDLQEPLRMVGSYTQLLARRYQGQLDLKANQYIEYTVDGVARMQTLIQDLLSYSRIGTQAGEFQSVDCECVLSEAIKNLQAAIEESGVAIRHERLPVIQGDFVQLVSLFQNLIGNAVKYRSEEPPDIHISCCRKQEEWEFSIKDNGIGIDPQFSERIFVIFQRLHSRAEYSGTGIGLAISKKIVERHRGRIRVESEPEHGSNFLFTIPLPEKASSQRTCVNP